MQYEHAWHVVQACSNALIITSIFNENVGAHHRKNGSENVDIESHHGHRDQKGEQVFFSAFFSLLS